MSGDYILQNGIIRVLDRYSKWVTTDQGLERRDYVVVEHDNKHTLSSACPRNL